MLVEVELDEIEEGVGTYSAGDKDGRDICRKEGRR